MSEYDESDKKITLVSQKNWVKATSEALNFDVEAVMNARKPITSRSDLDDQIRVLAVHILKFNDNVKIMRKTVAQYFLDIREAATRLGYDDETLRRITEEIFRSYNVSESQIRKVLPHELKDQGRTNLRYKAGQTITEEYNEDTYSDVDVPNDTEIQLKNAIERIKDVESQNRAYKERLANSVIIGQETKIYKGKVALDRERSLPLIVAINLKEDRLEYIEIDTEAIRIASEASIRK
jgi:hypothetical protein